MLGKLSGSQGLGLLPALPGLLSIGLIIAIVSAIVYAIKISQIFYWPVQQIEIDIDSQRVAKSWVQQRLAARRGENLLGLDVYAIKQGLQSQAMIQQVVVKKHWPDRLQVSIVTERPVARWNRTGLLTVAGRLIEPEAIDEFSQLPWLQGPKGSEQLLFTTYQQVAAFFRQALAGQAPRLHGLKLSPSGAWQLQIDRTLWVKLGSQTLLARPDQTSPLQRLVQLYQSGFMPKLADIEYIDARYPHGLAVRLKGTETKESASDLMSTHLAWQVVTEQQGP